MKEDSLYRQLHKLSAINSEEALDNMLSTLCKTRKTGLSSLEKSHFQSLLKLRSVSEVDHVLACLRSLIRRCLHQNYTGDDLLKLFPPGLPLDLQRILVSSFRKNINGWKEGISREEESLPRLKSMSWFMENNSASPVDKMAFIRLELQDYSKSPAGETEVKFKLTRDTLEAMLRSMTYIKEQLSSVGGTSSGPANKN